MEKSSWSEESEESLPSKHQPLHWSARALESSALNCSVVNFLIFEVLRGEIFKSVNLYLLCTTLKTFCQFLLSCSKGIDEIVYNGPLDSNHLTKAVLL